MDLNKIPYPYGVSSHKKLLVDSDLSEDAIEAAIEEAGMGCTVYEKPEALVAPMSDAYVAGRICQKYGLEFIGLPDEIMERDSWMLCSKFRGIFSPGV